MYLVISISGPQRRRNFAVSFLLGLTRVPRLCGQLGLPKLGMEKLAGGLGREVQRIGLKDDHSSRGN